MECTKLSIAIDELIGVPKVTLSGCMDSWHDQAISGVLAGFRDRGRTSLVLDLAQLSFLGVNGATSMVSALKTLGPEICVHVVTSAMAGRVLQTADLGSSIRLYASTDEIADYMSPSTEDLTSRWMPPSSEDSELPMAA